MKKATMYMHSNGNPASDLILPSRHFDLIFRGQSVSKLWMKPIIRKKGNQEDRMVFKVQEWDSNTDINNNMIIIC